MKSELTRDSLLISAAILVMGIGWTAPVSASVIRFDPDGDAPSANGIDIDTFDWAPGNGLAVNGNTAISNFLLGSGSTTFDYFYQAKLANLQLGGANVTPANLGPGGANELTLVAGISQTITFANGTTTVSSLAASPTINYFQIYFDPTRDANDLAGTGFTDELTGDTDGTLILSGSAVSAAGNFTIVGGGVGTPLDGFGGVDNYPTIDSVVGVGGASITVSVGSVDPGFFDLPVGALIDLSFFSSSQVLNFIQIDPSARFLTTTTTTASMIDPVLAGAGLGVASLGTIDGALTPTGGPDIQYQVDGSSVVNIIPEPSSLVLFGTTAACVIGFGWRRKRKTAA